MIYECSLPDGMGILVSQDSVHLGGKARNRLLKANIKLPMGSHNVSIIHLKTLLRDVQKSVHGLTYADVFPVDRMNYGSFEKIVQDRVINALREHVAGSEATVQYLLMFRDIVGSFLEFDSSPLDRIFNIFRGLFFIRIWRRFIKCARSYTIKDNFITYNTYMCIEINATNLIKVIKTFRNGNAPHLFLPALLDSQTCEREFRLFRSMGTTKFTKINFSILELIHMIGRVEIQNDIAYFKLNIDGVCLPHKRKEKTTLHALPTDEEILFTIIRAKEEALKQAEWFGMTNMCSDTNQIDDFVFESRLHFGKEDEEECEEGIVDDDDNIYGMDTYDCTHEFEAHEDDQDVAESVDMMDTTSCTTSTDPFELDPNSRFMSVIDENGVKKIVLKSTFLWMITGPARKISNDRLSRFRK